MPTDSNATIAETPREIGNRKIEELKQVRLLLLDASRRMNSIDGPIAAKIRTMVAEIESGLARVLLARELNTP